MFINKLMFDIRLTFTTALMIADIGTHRRSQPQRAEQNSELNIRKITLQRIATDKNILIMQYWTLEIVCN